MYIQKRCTCKSTEIIFFFVTAGLYTATLLSRFQKRWQRPPLHDQQQAFTAWKRDVGENVCVCMCVCVFLCACMCMYVYVYTSSSRPAASFHCMEERCWWVCVCMCMFVYVCVCMCMHVPPLHDQQRAFTAWKRNVRENVCVCMCMCVFVCEPPSSQVFTYMHTYIHAYIHTHTHTYIHTHIHIFGQWQVTLCFEPSGRN
jgi:hypothetical protein